MEAPPNVDAELHDCNDVFGSEYYCDAEREGKWQNAIDYASKCVSHSQNTEECAEMKTKWCNFVKLLIWKGDKVPKNGNFYSGSSTLIKMNCA